MTAATLRLFALLLTSSAWAFSLPAIPLYPQQVGAARLSETWGYDGAGRRTTWTDTDGKVTTYTYTATGQVETVADVRGVTRTTYDARDRVKQVEHPEGWVVSYTYDAAGNRESLTRQYTGQPARTTTYGYDDANRINRVTDPDNQTWSFTYDLAGNRKTLTQPSGVVATYTYDDRNRLTFVEYQKPGQPVMASYLYTWNAQGLRATVQSFNRVEGACLWTYTYDAFGRLTKANAGAGCAPGGDYTFEYDAVGNRIASNTPAVQTNMAYQYDENDRLVKVDRSALPSESGTPGYSNGRIRIAEYAYDAAGNLTRETRPPTFGAAAGDPPAPDRVTEYRWDAEGRMVGLTNPLAQEFSFAYDAEGQLVRKAEGATPAPDKIVYYLPDKNLPFAQILEERDGTGALKAQFEFGAGQVLKQTRDGASHFYHHDHLSVRGLTDANGAIQASYSFTPFGELSRATGTTPSLQPAVTNTQLFAGESFEPASGLYHLRARWMDPRWGRFNSLDPAFGRPLNPISLHRYLYSNDDPVNGMDPSGKMTMMNVVGAAGHISNLYTAGTIIFMAATGNAGGAGAMLIEEVAYSKLGGAFGKRIVELGKNQVRLFYGLFNGNSIKLTLGQGPNSGTLRNNLIAVGVQAPLGSQAHHIVGAATDVGQRTQALLKNKFGIDLNSPMNGVFLPGCGNSKTIGMIHCGKHTRDYEEAVERLLSQAQTKEEAINILSQIRYELLNNTFIKLNARS